ncbi:MAG: MFS transporter, partial [Chloroflexi bacterium]|nr:MFS transporter [Chloroflexota bacterium]
GYGFGVLIKPMSDALGWSRADLVLAQTLGGVTQGLSGPYMGRLVDRYGARWMMTGAGLVGGVILMLLPVIPNIWYYWIVGGAMMGFTRAGMFGVVNTTAVANWFIRRRGRALALSGLGVSASGIIMTQVMQWVVVHHGWGAAWTVLGLLMWVGMALPAALIVRRRPEDMGMLPDGALMPVPGAAPGAAGAAPAALEVDWEYRDAIRTPAYWLLTFTFVSAGVVLTGMLVNIAPHLQDIGMSPQAAASGLSLMAIGTFIGRFTAGFITEHIPLRWWLMVACLLAATGVFGLTTLHSDFLLLGLITIPRDFLVLGSVLVLGLGLGSSASLEMQAYPAYFGRKAAGRIRGLSEIFRIPAQFAGPLFAATLFDRTHSYDIAFTLFIGIDIVAACAMLFANPPRPPAAAREPVAAERIAK